MVAAVKKQLVFEPLGDQVIIEELPREDGLIVIPETADAGPSFGKVVAVGPGLWQNGAYSPTGIQVGDVVSMFSDYPFTEVPLSGKEYRVIRAAFLKCKVVEKA